MIVTMNKHALLKGPGVYLAWVAGLTPLFLYFLWDSGSITTRQVIIAITALSFAFVTIWLIFRN